MNKTMEFDLDMALRMFKQEVHKAIINTAFNGGERRKDGLFETSELENAIEKAKEAILPLIIKDNISKPGVFVFIKDENGRILLVKDRKGKWGLPGGGIEQGETVIEAAKREIREETGLDIKINQLIGVFSLQKSIGVVILFDGCVIGGEINSNGDSNEILACGFVSPQEIKKEIMYPAQFGLIQWVFKTNEFQRPIFKNPIPTKEDERDLLFDILAPQYPVFTQKEVEFILKGAYGYQKKIIV